MTRPITRAPVALVAVLVAVVSLTACDNTDAEQGVIARVNATRAAAGLPALRVLDDLTAKAQSVAWDLARSGQLAHGQNLAAGVTSEWHVLGENLGRGATLDGVYQLWLASPSHHANIVDPAFTDLGVGVVVGPDGTMWIALELLGV